LPERVPVKFRKLPVIELLIGNVGYAPDGPLTAKTRLPPYISIVNPPVVE